MSDGDIRVLLICSERKEQVNDLLNMCLEKFEVVTDMFKSTRNK